MNKKFLLSFLLFLFVSGLAAFSQGRRVVTYRTTNVNNMVVDIQAFLYEWVDVQPQFPGGEREMVKFINKERKYPEEAYKSGIGGRVLCSFIVEPTGEITNAEVIRGVEDSLNQEALRIIESMPKWIAGEVDGIKVPVYYILAIPFRR